jgi:RHS repeat-associated protein
MKMLQKTNTFGMLMPGRSFSSSNGYRFGFNGKEKDNELKGDGNSLDFGARIYDSRLGRWASLDPLQNEYPSNSAFSFSINSPIVLLDPDGRTVIFSTKDTKYLTGSSENPIFRKFEGMIQKSFDEKVKLTINNNTGIVSISIAKDKKLNESEQKIYNYLYSVISNPDLEVASTLVTNSENSLVDAYKFGEFDISDAEKLDKVGYSSLNSTVHFLSEQSIRQQRPGYKNPEPNIEHINEVSDHLDAQSKELEVCGSVMSNVRSCPIKSGGIEKEMRRFEIIDKNNQEKASVSIIVEKQNITQARTFDKKSPIQKFVDRQCKPVTSDKQKTDKK